MHFYNGNELGGRFIVDEEIKKGLPKTESLELKQGEGGYCGRQEAWVMC